MRKTAVGGLTVVVVALVVALVAGLSAGTSQAAPQKAGGKTITLWDYFISAPKERAALNRVAQQWAKKTGNKVVNPGDVAESMDKFRLSARTGRGPDVIQFPHDNLGRFAAATWRT